MCECVVFCFAFLRLKQIIHKLSRVFVTFFVNKTCLCFFCIVFHFSSFVFSLERRAFFFVCFFSLVVKNVSVLFVYVSMRFLPRAPNVGSHDDRKDFACPN